MSNHSTWQKQAVLYVAGQEYDFEQYQQYYNFVHLPSEKLPPPSEGIYRADEYVRRFAPEFKQSLIEIKSNGRKTDKEITLLNKYCGSSPWNSGICADASAKRPASPKKSSSGSKSPRKSSSGSALDPTDEFHRQLQSAASSHVATRRYNFRDYEACLESQTPGYDGPPTEWYMDREYCLRFRKDYQRDLEKKMKTLSAFVARVSRK